MSLTRVAILANSWKHGDWCLAGIDLATGKWVRPVTALDDGRVPCSDMKLGGYFPSILDVFDIPLAPTGPDFGFQIENRSILPGQWHLAGKMHPKDLLQYAERPRYILHNRSKYVTVQEMTRRPFERRTTLQLVRTSHFEVRDRRKDAADKSQWKGVVYSGGRRIELPLTDPVYFEKLNQGYEPSKSCLLTMSLGMPHKPADWEEDEEPVCWKLIAGVIELE